MADRLRARGCEKLHFTQNPRRGVYWLNWSNADLADVARRLGCGDFSLSWGMTFAHHRVRAGFWLYQTEPEEQDPLDRLKRFMQATPINRHKPDEYPMRDSGYGWYRVYDHEILSQGRAFRHVRTRGHGRGDPVAGGLHGFGRLGVQTH